MENLVTLYHGGSMEEDGFGNVTFVGMRKVTLIFADRPTFREMISRACEELNLNSNYEGMSVDGIYHIGQSDQIMSRLVPIKSEDAWEKYVNTMMKNEFK